MSYEYESPATLASEEGIDYGKEKIVERIASSEDTNDGEDDACIKRPFGESEKEEEFISEQEHHLNKQVNIYVHVSSFFRFFSRLEFLECDGDESKI